MPARRAFVRALSMILLAVRMATISPAQTHMEHGNDWSRGSGATLIPTLASDIPSQNVSSAWPIPEGSKTTLRGHVSTLYETTTNRNTSLPAGFYQLCQLYKYDCDCKTYACHCYTSDCNCFDYDCNCKYTWGVKTSCDRCRACSTCQTCQTCTSCYATCTGEACTTFTCPENSNSGGTPRHDAITDCTCNTGMTGPDGGPCSSCGAGKFKSVSGSAACTSCARGKFASDTAAAASSVCQWCGPGKFSELAATACTECPAGKFSKTTTDNDNADKCLDCPRGTYAQAEGTTECDQCPAGKFNNATGAYSVIACLDCDAGKYSQQTGISGPSDCVDCVAGKYSKTMGANSLMDCLDCPAGTHTAAGATFCDCNAGYARSQACANSSTAWPCAAEASAEGSCAACAAGTFKAESTGHNASTCLPCKAGTYSNVSATVCANCTAQPGNYCPRNWPTTATGLPCPQGSFCPGGSSDLVRCPLGTYTPYEGAWSRSACVWCAPGYRWTGRIGHELTPELGLWYDHAHELEDEAVHEIHDEHGEHTEVRLGWFKDYSEDDGVKDSAMDRMTLEQLVELCRKHGLSTDGSKQDLIDRFRLSKRVLVYQECVACPANTFVNYPGNHSTLETRSCTTCERGTYAPPAATVCRSCTVDRIERHQYDNGRPDIIERYSTNQTLSAVPNRLKDEHVFDAFDCQCDPGCAEECSDTACYRSLSKNHSAAILACELWGGEMISYYDWGSFLWAGQTKYFNYSTLMHEGLKLLNASSGFYFSSVESETDGLGRKWCALVHWNVSSDKSWNSTLLAAPQGDDSIYTRMTDHYGTREYVWDPPATPNQALQTRSSRRHHWHALCDNPMPAICRKCNPNVNTYSAACQRCANTCPAGHYYMGCNATFNGCWACPPGTFSTSPATTCTECSAGKYAPSHNQSACLTCPAGKSSAGAGWTYRTYFERETGLGGGATGCSTCAIGWHNPVAGGECQLCESRVSPTGATACTVCAPGTHEPYSGVAPLCPQCRPGQYSAQNASTDCSVCAPGKFAPHAGISSCLVCSAGSFSEVNRSTACTLCAAGTSAEGYHGPSKSANRSLACSKCVQGKFIAALGALNCTKCAKGTYSNARGSSACILCSPGSYAQSHGATACANCSSGSYAVAFTPAAGHNADCANECVQNCSTGQGVAASVDNGLTRACVDVAACVTKCRAQYPPVLGTHGGAVLCLACEAGSHAPRSGASACVACAPQRYQPDANQTACLLCAPGSVPDVGTKGSTCRLCEEGKYSNDSQTCQACSPPSVWSFAGSTSSSNCSCAPGYAQLTGQGTSCQPCSAGTARPKSFIAKKKDCGPCRYGDYPAHGIGDNYSYEYGDFYLDGYAYTHAPNYRNFPLHATCESCGGAAAAPYDAVTGLRSRILGPSHTFIYTNPGVDCAWRCTDGFYKWEADEHTAYCKPCPPNTSSSVDAWHLTYEGKTWAIEKELVENDHLRPRAFFEWYCVLLIIFPVFLSTCLSSQCSAS